MASGKVKWFNSRKGFGFILADKSQKDIFLHITVLIQAGLSNVSEGQPVTFDVAVGNDGREAAINLVII